MSQDKMVKDLIDKTYIMDWLASGPEETGKKKVLDSNKRFNTLLENLLKETETNVLRFKARQK